MELVTHHLSLKSCQESEQMGITFHLPLNLNVASEQGNKEWFNNLFSPPYSDCLWNTKMRTPNKRALLRIDDKLIRLIVGVEAPTFRCSRQVRLEKGRFKKTTAERFELSRSENNGLAIHRLNHSATLSVRA
eukprot:scaffold25303_cov117-Cylindrotheca_fusiformis.AAC.2